MPRVPSTFKDKFLAQPEDKRTVRALFDAVKDDYGIEPLIPGMLARVNLWSGGNIVSEEDYDNYVNDLNDRQPQEPQEEQKMPIAGQMGGGSSIQQQQDLTVTFTIVSHSQDAQRRLNKICRYFTEELAKQYFYHVQQAYKKQQLKPGTFKAALEGKLEAVDKRSGGGDKENLLPDFFVFEILPKNVSFEWSPDDYRSLETCRPVKFECKWDKRDGGATIRKEDEVEDQKKWESFENLCAFFNGEKIQFIKTERLSQACQEMVRKFVAIEPLMEELETLMMQFAAKVFQTPKGILLYGPPGTGKSAISGSLCKALKLCFAAPPMAAGDFNKGIVGDSERMLNAIADRAQLIPWEMTVLLIDEIDTLAPNRADPSNANNKGGDLLGVFLAIMDGAKATPNLKIIASTNLREKMDDAFLRRMEIQVFMGNPSSKAREDWISYKVQECYKQPHYAKIKQFVEDKDEKPYLVCRTINFSQDALRKVLERFLESAMAIGGQPQQYSHQQLWSKLRGILDYHIQTTAVEMRVKLGGFTVFDIMGSVRQNPHNPEFYKTILEGREAAIQPGATMEMTKRMLIDISAPLDETLQIETRIVTAPGLKNQIASLAKFEYQGDHSYKVLIKEHFPYIRHIDPVKHEENEYNQYRRTVQNGNERHLWDSPIKGRDAFNHFKDSVQIYLSGDYSEMLSKRMGISQAQVERDWLKHVVRLSQLMNVDVIKVIDANFFLQNQMSEDQHTNQLLINTVEEAKKYKKAMVVFELDSLSGVMKEHQPLTEEPRAPTITAVEKAGNNAGFTYQKSRPQTFKTALSYGQVAMKQSSSSKYELYIIYVSKERKITQEAKSMLNLPAAPHETAFEDEDFDSEKQQRCKYCCETFTQKENLSEQKCGAHFEKLYRVSDFARLKQQYEQMKPKPADPEAEAIMRCPDIEFEAAINMVRHNGARLSDFRWKCCRKGIFEKGEIPAIHEPMDHDFDQFLTVITGRSRT